MTSAETLDGRANDVAHDAGADREDRRDRNGTNRANEYRADDVEDRFHQAASNGCQLSLAGDGSAAIYAASVLMPKKSLAVTWQPVASAIFSMIRGVGTRPHSRYRRTVSELTSILFANSARERSCAFI